ncbi:hypothetical protein Tco_0587479 [Tanacetum coccineum]
MESQSDSTQTVSSLKLHMLKTGDYDLWSMRMEQYLTHTNYALWEVIVNGDAPANASASTDGPIPPKTAEQKIARKNELKAKSTLLLAIPDEHLLKFHGIKDAKSLWEDIKTRFGGNKESKKMQKTTNTNSTNRLNIVSLPVNTVSSSFTTVDPGRARDQRNEFESVFGQDNDVNSTYRMFTPISTDESSYENLGGSTPVNAATPSNADYPTDPLMPDLEDTADLQDTGIFGNAYDDEDVGAEADLNNLETTMSVSPIPTTRIHKDHPKEQIITDINLATQTRRMIKMS